LRDASTPTQLLLTETPSPAAVTEVVAAPVTASPITVVGIADDRPELLAPEARQALTEADVVVGGRRELWLWRWWVQQAATRHVQDVVEVGDDPDELAGAVRQRATGTGLRVCVLVPGDPGFFGVVGALDKVVDRHDLRIVPGPSAVSLSFSRLGLPWEDCTVLAVDAVSLADTANVVRTARKAAVLTSPSAPPEALGRALVEAGAAMDLVAVCSRLGSADEGVTELTLTQLSAGRFDPRSVVVLLGPGIVPMTGWTPGRATQASGAAAGSVADQVLAWGLPDTAFAHRTGAMTKAEIRSVVLGKLALPAAGVLWDVGAGSGSVAVECALLRPGLTVLAVEEGAEDAASVTSNAMALGAAVHVVNGRAPEALGGLPAPDRAFVGGGGIDVLEATLEALRPGGRVVATFSAIERALAAADMLGNLVQIGVGRGEHAPERGWRLTARDPVFVVWGPGHSSPDEPDTAEEW
jgi:precorrin-6Y C5,15-methyltransferase (decarboxylating)